MDRERALDYARAAVAFALEAGASQAQARVVSSRRCAVQARDRTLTSLERSSGATLRLRIFCDGRTATLSTTPMSRDDLRSLVAAAVESAGHVERDPHAGLPDPSDLASPDDRPDLALVDAAMRDRSDGERIEEALEMERTAREADPRIVNSEGSRYDDAFSIIALADSHGFTGAYEGTRAHRSCSPVALDGSLKRLSHYGTAGRRLSEMESAESVARTAARRAVEMCGARRPPSGRFPVVFERDVAASLLSELFAAVNAANVARGDSWLIGKLGERVGSSSFTVIDDGRIAGAPGSAPFDAEGVATRRTVVLDRGVLQTYLYDTYYARKLGARSTGNASGDGVAPTTFLVSPGEGSLETIVRATRRGLLVFDLIGFSTEHASGLYSRGASGFWIEDGEVAYPVDGCTIAGMLPEMFANVDAVAADLRIDGSIVSPSLRIAEMIVSGDE